MMPPYLLIIVKDARSRTVQPHSAQSAATLVCGAANEGKATRSSVLTTRPAETSRLKIAVHQSGRNFQMFDQLAYRKFRLPAQ